VRAAALWRRQEEASSRYSASRRLLVRLQEEDGKVMKRKASISHDDAIVEELRRDPEFAAEYLRAALEESDEPKVLLVVLRHLAEAKGGVAKIAKAAGVKRESLYRALSENGNPRLSTLTAVLKAVGLRLTVEETIT
jgi:probable addiction module antidote protein